MTIEVGALKKTTDDVLLWTKILLVLQTMC
jgi:hypothetical protein